MTNILSVPLLVVNFDLTEWYHYVLIVLLLVILFFVVKYFDLVEQMFKPLNRIQNGVKSARGMLISSFLLGLLMVLIWMFKPLDLSSEAEKYWIYSENICYGLLILLLLINIYFSIANYKLMSGILRSILISALMLVYYYSGMYAGLLILIVMATLMIIYAIFRLKKKLTLR